MDKDFLKFIYGDILWVHTPSHIHEQVELRNIFEELSLYEEEHTRRSIVYNQFLSNSVHIHVMNDLNRFLLSDYSVSIFKSLLPMINKKELILEDSERKTFLHYLFCEVNNPYRIEIIKLLVSKLDRDILSKKCYIQYCPQISLLRLFSIGSYYNLQVIELLMPYIDKELLSQQGQNCQTSLHFLFENVDNKYKVEVLRLLLPVIDEDLLLIRDNRDRTCLDSLTWFISNQYKKDAINLLGSAQLIQKRQLSMMNKILINSLEIYTNLRHFVSITSLKIKKKT